MQYSVLTAQQAQDYSSEEGWGRVDQLAGVEVGNAVGVSLGRVLFKPGQADPLHAHDNCEEVVYVVSGVFSYTLGDESVILRRGDTLVVSAGVFHNGRNIGSEPAEIIRVLSAGKGEIRIAST